MAVNKRLKEIYMGFFDGLETRCANFISNFTERAKLKKYLISTPPHSLHNQVVNYWKKYKQVSPKWAWYYASKNGIEDPRYIPNDLYYTKIDQYFNDRKLGWGFNDKNYYSKIFEGIKQPEVLVRKINGILLDSHYCLLSVEMALHIIGAENEIVVKPSLETGSGQGVCFWKVGQDNEIIREFIENRKKKDYVIQKVIKQHAELNKVHDGSINSLRIVSLLMPEGIYILSSNLRMGVDASRIDNVTAGGISCGIDENGCLKKYATTYYSGERMEKHPQGFVFDGFKIPSYDKALELVKKAHPTIPHFRLVSWDIAIDEQGDPVLIEANMRKGGINLNQFNNGPLFGELTDRVLDEVFDIS